MCRSYVIRLTGKFVRKIPNYDTINLKCNNDSNWTVFFLFFSIFRPTYQELTLKVSIVFKAENSEGKGRKVKLLECLSFHGTTNISHQMILWYFQSMENVESILILKVGIYLRAQSMSNANCFASHSHRVKSHILCV